MNGSVHEGLIKYNFGYKQSFKFKQSNDSKPKNIRSRLTKGFVIESDSFTVIQNFRLLRGQGTIVNDFAQVIEVGSIILLKNYSQITYGTTGGRIDNGVVRVDNVETFILTKPGSDQLWTVFSKKKKFNELIGDIIKDFPEDSKLKNLDDLTYDMVPEIISEYNQLNMKKKTKM